MAELLSLKDIGSLLELLDKHEVAEFKLERDKETLWLKRGQQALTQQEHAASGPIHQIFTSMPGQGYSHGGAGMHAGYYETPPQGSVGGTPPAQPSEPAQAVEKNSRVKDVTSPMVGTFYRRPSVDADPYVDVGDKVKKGDVLCIIEAMKLMNEIEAEFAGTIVEVCLEDGQMVEYGEPLFKIDPL